MENMIALEQIVNKLPGVKGAKILADDGGTLKEIHILADVKKPAKQLVRDIETAIYAASGVKIDRKILTKRRLPMKQQGLAFLPWKQNPPTNALP